MVQFGPFIVEKNMKPAFETPLAAGLPDQAEMDAVRAARIAQLTFHSSEESNHAPDVEQSNVDDASMSEFEQDASENEEASPLQHAHLDEYEVISEEADCSIVSDFSYPAETEEQ